MSGMKKHKGVSVIVPYHNDTEDLIETLESLYDTMRIDPWEVIVVNDGGRNKLKMKKRNLIHIDNPVHLGVGRAFDIGVSASKYDTLFLSGADITHNDNDYAPALYESVQQHPTGLICTVCSSYRKPSQHHYGADILFKITEDDLPPKSKLRGKPDGHRSILEGKWRPKTGDGTYQIPSLMGAFYGVSKPWYDFIRGFNLHYQWGSLEPYISLKSWLLGGEVLINTEIDVLHKTGREGFARKDQMAYIYNRIMIALVVFGPYGIPFAEHLGQDRFVQRAGEQYQDWIEDISYLRKHIEENAIYEPDELHRRMVSLSYFHTSREKTE